MTEQWQIRTARATDAVELARLAGLLGYPSDAATMVVRLQRMASPADHRVVVAAPVGAATRGALGGWMHVARHITLESGEFAELLGLVVDPTARRSGVGRTLVLEAERWAREQRLARLTVRSNAARTESHDFYPALGYTRAKTQHVYSKVLGEHAAGIA